MAKITWNTSKKATVTTSSKINFDITIKKSAGGLCYNLLNSENKIIGSAGDLDGCKVLANEYYNYF